MRAEWERFWDVLSFRVDEAVSLEQLAADVRADDLTHELIVLVEGISVQAVLYPQRVPPHRQIEILDSILDRASARTATLSGPARRPVGRRIGAISSTCPVSRCPVSSVPRLGGQRRRTGSGRRRQVERALGRLDRVVQARPPPFLVEVVVALVADAPADLVTHGIAEGLIGREQ